MNARTIVRELSEEMRFGLIEPDEAKLLFAEAKSILSKDPIVSTRFPHGYASLKKYLDDVPEPPKKSNGNTDGKKKDDDAKRRCWKDCRYIVDDFAASIQRKYFDELCACLPGSIKPGNEAEIAFLTGSMLSDLLDRGWTLEVLYRWHRHFINRAREYSFNDNLAFALRQLQRKSQDFRVILRLSGATRVASLNRFKKFSFSQSITDPSTDASIRNFLSQNPNTCFAEITLKAVDHEPAAFLARERFGPLLDLIRFDYERRSIAIDQDCYVKRMGDGRIEIVKVENTVPNPVESQQNSDFFDFAKRFNAVLAPDALRPESRRKLQGAIRQYRFGRDSSDYKDKFLNWWFGIENLCYPKRLGAIGATVTENVAAGMLNGYLQRLVRDLLTTLKYFNPEWPAEWNAELQCDGLASLTIPQLLRVLHSQDKVDRLKGAMDSQPILASHLTKIASLASNPGEAAEQLKAHRRRLQWHVSRLYRIRCSIVHGATVRFKLALFSANLEYYLKQMILLAIDAFYHHQQIADLDDLFERCRFAADRSIATLESNNATADDVDRVILSDVVVRDFS